MWFEVISRLKINLEKSELISIGKVPIMEDLVDILGCKVGSLPSKYLGLPLGVGLGGRDDAKKARKMEETIPVQGGTLNSFQKYLV